MTDDLVNLFNRPSPGCDSADKRMRKLGMTAGASKVG